VGRAVTRISLALDRLCREAAVGFFAAMLVLVLFQVVARYIFRTVPVWTEEAARYCMVWGGLLGATAAFKADSEPRLIQPPQAGPRWWINSAAWLRGAATVIFLGPVLYHSERFIARGLGRTTEALGIPAAWVTLAVPAAVAVIFFHLLARLLGAWAGPAGKEA